MALLFDVCLLQVVVDQLDIKKCKASVLSDKIYILKEVRVLQLPGTN
jgi:hypothetical protein